MVRFCYTIGISYPAQQGLTKKQVKNAVGNRLNEFHEVVTDFCIENAEKALDIVKDQNLSGKFGGRKLTQALGDCSNLAEGAAFVLVGNINTYLDSVNKLKDLDKFFEQQPEAFTQFLEFGRSTFAEAWLSYRWNVKQTFSRNFLVGIRNKLDNHLPPSIQYGARIKMPDECQLVFASEIAISEIAKKIQQRIQLKKPVKNLKCFLGKLKLVYRNLDLIENYQDLQVKWKSTKNLENWFLEHLRTRKEGKLKYKQLGSAIRMILTLAVFPKAVCFRNKGVLKDASNCLSKPFRGKKYQEGKYNPQPLSLIWNYKCLIAREKNAKLLTNSFRAQGFTEIEIIHCSHEGFKIKPKIRLHATDRMKDILKDDRVKIAMLRILPPRGPSRKVCAQAIMEGPLDAFTATKHLRGVASFHPVSPSGQPIVAEAISELAVDRNRMGVHMMSYSGNVDQSDELSRICEHYDTVDKKISELQKIRSIREQRGKAIIKLAREIYLLYQKKKKLRREAHIFSGVDISRNLFTTKADVLLAEDLSIDTWGKKGGLAKASLSMVDERRPLVRAVASVSKSREKSIDFELIPIRKLKKIHVGCGGKLPRGKKGYDFVFCTQCGEKVNTHKNEANMMIKIYRDEH